MSNYVRGLPAELIKLEQYVLRSFYEFELYLVMDMLRRYPCIKEDQLIDILKLDGKKVREYLMQLKAEKFVNEKLVIETTSDNKQNKVLHYFINHKMTVNVIKYKLDNMRKQIELEEKQLTCRANYKCKQCGHVYDDLDVVQLYYTNMRCIRCDTGEVDEDVSSLPKAQSRNLLATFNTQTKPIFESLQAVEHMNLEPHILNPAPADYSGIIDGSSSRPPSHQQIVNSINSSNPNMWSGEKSRIIASETPMTIKLSTGDNEVSLNDRILISNALNSKSKEQNDYIDGITPDNSLSVLKERSVRNPSSFLLDYHIVPEQQQITSKNQKSLADSIMDILIVYENKSVNQIKKLNGIQHSLNNGFHSNEHFNHDSMFNNKKREFNHTTSDDFADSAIVNDLNNNQSDEDDINNNINKKRKLNGKVFLILFVILILKLFMLFIIGYYSDIDIEQTSFYDNNSNTINGLIYGSNNNNGNLIKQNGYHHLNGHNDNHMLMDIDENDTNHYHPNCNGSSSHDDYLIKIQNDFIPIENITSDVINKMNKQEKLVYIDKCRQLYTAMIE